MSVTKFPSRKAHAPPTAPPPTPALYSWDMERLAVGAALIDPNLLDDSRLRGDHYHRPHLGALWEFMRQLRADAAGQSEPMAMEAWMVHVVERRRAHGDSAVPGTGWPMPPTAEILDLPRHCPSTRAMPVAVDRIIEYAAAREIVRECGLVSAALADGEPADEVVARFCALADRLSAQQPTTRQGWARLGAVAIEAAEAAVRPADGERVSTGLHTLDGLLGGLRPADLVILGARPSMGKTALALQLAIHVATVGRTVGIFSMEMSREALAHRALARESGVPIQDIRAGGLDGHQARAVAEATPLLAGLPLWIDDAVGLTVDALAARTRRLAHTAGAPPALIVVDYMQLARAPVGRGDSRERVVAEVSMGLKAIAREHRCTVLALAQLNRDATKRDGGRPALADLRDSGQIEQDADVVMLLHRPIVCDHDHPDPSAAEVIVAKQRQGPTGVVPLRFSGVDQIFRPDLQPRDQGPPRPASRPDYRRGGGHDEQY